MPSCGTSKNKKMITPKFFGKINQGKIVYDDAKDFYQYIAAKFKDDTEVEITVKKKFKRRTSGLPGEETDFNGYYWAVIVRMVADEIGEVDQEKVHDWIQIAVGNTKVMRDGTRIPAGTSDLSGAEFSDYCSRARMWAGNQEGLNIYIPEPYETTWGKTVEK